MSKEKNRIKSSRWANKNPEAIQNKYLKYKYGLTLEEYNELLVKQNGLCAGCFKPETRHDHRTGKIRKLAVDHKHDETKKVRGLLCGSCNMAIGFLEDNSDRLRNLANYIDSNK